MMLETVVSGEEGGDDGERQKTAEFEMNKARDAEADRGSHSVFAGLFPATICVTFSH